MPPQSHYVCVTVRMYADSVPLPADEPRHRSMWLGPLHDPVLASEIATRFRTTYASKDPEVTLHPEVPADIEAIPVDEAFLAEPDLVEAVHQAALTRRAVVAARPAGADDFTGDIEVTDDAALSGSKAPVNESVDWRAIFLKYAEHVGVCEGIDFLSDSWDAESKFTPVEWAAISEACAAR